MNPKQHQRINVVGVSGSGKSTFARTLAQKLEMHSIEMDALFWGPNWTESSDVDFFAKLQVALAGDTWVLDGNYSRSTEIKWSRATQVIWLDFPFRITLCRAVRRAISRAYHKKEIWSGTGNYETFRKSFFSHDSPIFWTIISHKKVRRRYLDFMTYPQYSHIDFVRLRSPKESAHYLSKHPQAPSHGKNQL